MDNLAKHLKKGSACVTKTDTIYGLLAQANNASAVQRIYSIKGRDENKPFIVLISDKKQLSAFGLTLDEKQDEYLKDTWPGPVTIIFALPDPALEKFEYLHRGTKSLAFRLPNDPFMVNLINKTGPLVAPSANPQGFEPATNIVEAQSYFKDDVDFYYDRGKVLNNNPSKSLDIHPTVFK